VVVSRIGHTVTSRPVSTRMLITLAVICAVLILAAAGVQLWLTMH
jgi:hypothetical protein